MKSSRILLGARIQELRKARRLSQRNLSEKVNIDPKHLSRIEVGNSYPSLKTLERIAAVLRVDLKDMFEFVPHVTDKELQRAIKKMLHQADTDKLKLIFRVTKAIMR